MGTASYVLVGEPGGEAFHSTCHGAGRRMSRTAARKQVTGQALRRQLAGAGIEVRAGSGRGLAEEAPFAYKDVDAVVETVERAGLARRVARLRPVGVVKG
jgi:tRNA-splicing ligase RtcB